ncbi:hypothetical protein Chor_015088 [Crotalus horridus]
MSFPIDFSVAMWTLGLGAIGAAVTGIILANTDLFLTKAENASLEFLEEIDLKTLSQGGEQGFENSGTQKKTLQLSRDTLDQVGVPLYAVVKESIGTEVADFQPYFKGEIFLDEKRKFYGPQKRKMLFLALFRWNVWRNFWRAWRSGYTGNLDGEGVILGGVFVIGPGRQGLLLEHREKEFGDKVSRDAVLDAVKKIKAQPSDRGE